MRSHRWLIGVMFGLSLLMGCASNDGAYTPPETPGQQTTPGNTIDEPGNEVTIGFAAPEFERQTYAPLIDAFNQQNPGIRVQFVPLDESSGPGQAFDMDALMERTVTAADTAAAFFVTPQHIARGWLYDLAPLIDADSNFDRDDFYSGALAPDKQSGGIFVLPRSLRVSLLSYNKDLWQSRGLPTPQPDWTWEDVLAAAEQLAQKRGTTIDTYGLVDWNAGVIALASGLIVAGVDLSGSLEQLRLDQPQSEAALKRVADLIAKGALFHAQDTGDGPAGFEQARQLIQQQQAGMWRAGMLPQGPRMPQLSFAVGTASFPPVPSPFSTDSAEGYIMSSGTQHPQEAWRWLSFLSRQEIRRPGVFMDGTSHVPARKSIAERSGYWSQFDEDARAAIMAAIERGTRTPQIDAKIFSALGQALNDVVAGKPAAQALVDAQTSLSQQIAQAQQTPTPEPSNQPIVVATPVPDVAPEGATKLTFAAPPFNAGKLRQLARDFNRQHPELFVEVKNVMPAGGPPRLAELAGQSDCFMGFGPPQSDEISATLDLQPLFDADPTFKIDDYPAALLAPFRAQTGLYGLPHAVTLRVMKYNQDIFDAAGISYPSETWTLDELLDTAQKLTQGQDAQKQYGFASIGNQTDDVLFFLDRVGAMPVRGSGDTRVPNFTDPEVIQAIRDYIELLRNASPHKRLNGYSREMGGIEAFQLVNSGRVAMWFDLGTRIVLIGPEKPDFTTAIAPPPLGTSAATARDIHVSGLYISANTAYPEACWSWLKHLSGELSLLEFGDFPARRSLAKSELFQKQAPPGADRVYAAYQAALDRLPSTEEQTAAGRDMDYFWFARAIDRALQGEDLERELADAEGLTKAYLDCVHNGEKPGVCATQIDPTYQGFADQD